VTILPLSYMHRLAPAEQSTCLYDGNRTT